MQNQQKEPHLKPTDFCPVASQGTSARISSEVGLVNQQLLREPQGSLLVASPPCPADPVKFSPVREVNLM